MTPARGLAWTVLGFLLLWLFFALALGCAVSHTRRVAVEVGPQAPERCGDGAPPVLFADPACVTTGCGWSCLPGR